MTRFNELHANYAADGLEMLSANYVNTDTEIQDFITNFGATYSFARVADASGYTVPQFSTCFAIGRDGTLLWTGYSGDITDQMVESWVAQPAAPSTAGCQGPTKDEYGCAARGDGKTHGIVLLCALAALACLGTRRRTV